MKTSQMLKAFASDLERDDNEALMLSEDNPQALEIVATALVKAAQILKEAAELAESLEPNAPPAELDSSAIDSLAALATQLDSSEDPEMRKQASVLDQILLTISAPKGAKTAMSKAEEERIETLKKEYSTTKEQLDEVNKVADAVKAVEKSEYYKEYLPLEAPLSTRHCPDHPGAPMARVGEGEYQCSLDKKTYNFVTGFRTMKGNTVPGGKVDNQSKMDNNESHSMFDTRESRLGNNFER